MTRVRIGIVGLGAAGFAFIAPLRKHAGVEWVAVAEPDEGERARCAAEHGVATYASLREMLDHPGLDAVYIATPTDLHAAQTIEAARAGKHVLVEKPMATTLDDARAMVEAAERAGVVLLVGHSHSHDLPIRRMRDLITSGEYGAARMVHSWCYTDWVRRPRRAAELDPALGGGVTFRQGAHQFDIIRLLCGGLARSVRARTFDWDAERRTVGAHSVWLEFDDASATAVYSGYGHFATPELYGGIGEWGTPPQAAVPSGPASGQSELAAKRERARSAIPTQAPHQPFFGLTLVSCERADMRQSADGLLLYAGDGRREIALPNTDSPRDLVIAEFHDAVVSGRPPIHDGRWGLANLEVCVAAHRSSLTRAEVRLHEQVPVRSASTL